MPAEGGPVFAQEAAFRALWRWLTYYGATNGDETAPQVKVSGVASIGTDINSDSMAVGGGENSTGTRHIAVVDSSGRWVVVQQYPAAGNPYIATTLTSGSVTLTGQLMALRVFASGADATFKFGTGSVITVRNNTGFDWQPLTVQNNLVLNWVSGTIDVFAEML